MRQESKYILLSLDDSVKEVIKAAKLLEKYNLPATFFLDTIRLGKELSIQDVISLSEFHEVGSHGLTHRDLTKLSKQEAFYELSRSKAILSKIIKKEISSFAYPYGDYNKFITTMVKKAGYRCARTTIPYDVNIDSNLYELRTTIWADPNPYRYYPYALKGFIRDLNLFGLIWNPSLLKDWHRLALYLLEKFFCARKQLKLQILIHPRLIEKRHEWSKLEDLCNFISSYRSFFNVVTISQYCDCIGKEM
jgi:peptidoglycan/xylan/chitin deacetylase (PgdA/CDA1 family)